MTDQDNRLTGLTLTATRAIRGNTLNATAHQQRDVSTQVDQESNEERCYKWLR